jgi:hypothetical protein
MTYDAARRETILFGGTTGAEGSSYQQDTWRWNGSVWQELTSLITRPPSRDNHAMAFDRNRGLVTLFGGSGSAEQNTTWEWNGVAWSARNTPGPVGRTGSAMAFDSARNGVLLFGGYAPSGSPFSAQASFYSGPVPVFSTQPIGGRVPPGTNVQLSAATSSSNVTFKWSRNGYELFDGGRISGTTTPMLSISAITLADEGIYTLVIAGACGSQISQAARLLVGGCVADFDDGSGTGTPDNGVGIEDLLYYLSIYDAGVSQADVDDGTGTGHFDGGVGIEDLLYYLARYDAGC